MKNYGLIFSKIMEILEINSILQRYYNKNLMSATLTKKILH